MLALIAHAITFKALPAIKSSAIVQPYFGVAGRRLTSHPSGRLRRRLIPALDLMKNLLAALVIFVSFSASAADAFHYDQRLAMDLSRAYLSALNRQHPAENGYADAAHGLVSSAIAAHDRHLVFVTFAGASGLGGSYVKLELCKETNLLTVVEVGAVDNIQAYRDDVVRVNSKIYVSSPAVCSVEVP